MFRLLKKIRKDERGTALLVALLVMGVLIAISLALSALVLSEARSTRELVDSGRAYYAAESGIEQALYKLDTNLPGWEGSSNNLGEIGENAVFSYQVDNKCNSYPCFDEEEYDLDSMFEYNFYDVLELNETITIPLFSVDENNKVVTVQDFVVEFYVQFNPTQDLVFDNANQLSGWDVLRWKVFGMRRSTEDGSLLTESIHDFTAVSSVRNGEQDYTTNSIHPSWFGTRSCEGFTSPGDRSKTTIKCIDYAEALSSEGKYCTNTQARDFYLYDDNGSEFQTKVACYPISDFLERNDPATKKDVATGLNYLSLTNLMNPSMLDPAAFPNGVVDASKIYFRVETFGDETVREFAKITSDGFSGDTKQSIKVNIKRDSYMPVFNFSIYSTYQSDEDDPFYTYSATKQDEGQSL